jgi:hypothetical protein
VVGAAIQTPCNTAFRSATSPLNTQIRQKNRYFGVNAQDISCYIHGKGIPKTAVSKLVLPPIFHTSGSKAFTGFIPGKWQAGYLPERRAVHLLAASELQPKYLHL